MSAPSAEDPGPSTALAAFVAGLRLENVPAETMAHARHLLLDAVACAFVADHSEETPQIKAFIAAALAGSPEASVIGEPERRSLAGAVVANGFAITAVTLCDVYTAAHCHITPEVVPPALALAEVTGADGASLMAATVAGLETATRVARGIGYDAFRARGWHAPGVVGPFGGAASVASLLGLDAERTRNALALAGSQSAGTWAAWGTPAMKFHQARGALSGTLAGLLAAEGFGGSTEILAHPDGGIFSAYAEGGDPTAVTDELGARWELDEISLRLWPSGTPLQPVITALFELVHAGLPEPEKIRQVLIRVPPHVLTAHAQFAVPSGTFDALLSLPYAAAVILHDHEAWLDQFGPARYSDPVLHRFIERVQLEADNALPRDGGAVEIELANGERRVAAVDVAKGHPRDRLSAAELDAKFHRCVDTVLGPAPASELLERLLTLEHQSDLAPLFTLLRVSGRERQRGAEAP